MSQDEKRIYVIVANTVQNPLAVRDTKGDSFIMVPTSETKTIIQPKGRIAAQVGHVVSSMRMARLNALHYAFNKAALAGRKKVATRISAVLTAEPVTAFTTIVLAVPDSYQLEFRQNLIQKADIRVHAFFDENVEYGRGAVKTAICTEPVTKEELNGTTDYLELWS